MKLSNAIEKGNGMKRPNPITWLSEDGSCGCALGGAALAVGLESWNFPQIFIHWPWLNGEHIRTISGLYRDKTIEDVVAYVRSVEPSGAEAEIAELEEMLTP